MYKVLYNVSTGALLWTWKADSPLDNFNVLAGGRIAVAGRFGYAMVVTPPPYIASLIAPAYTQPLGISVSQPASPLQLALEYVQSEHTCTDAAEHCRVLINADVSRCQQL